MISEIFKELDKLTYYLKTNEKKNTSKEIMENKYYYF